MSRQVLFNSKFWNDPWVVDNLSPEEGWLYFYLITNGHANVIGIYEISLRTICYETKLEKERIEEMLQRFSPRVQYIDGWIVMANTLKNQNYRSPKMQAAVEKLAANVPEDLLQYVKWPDDYGAKKPKGSAQISLLDNKNQHNVAQTSTKQHDEVLTTETGVAYGMHTVSHSNRNSNRNYNPRPSGLVATEAAGDASPVPKVRKQEIDDVFDYWHKRVGYKIESRVKQNRYAASNLLKKHGQDKLKRLIDGVAVAKQDRYAPGIADFSALQSKFNEFISWGHRRSHSNTEVIS